MSGWSPAYRAKRGTRCLRGSGPESAPLHSRKSGGVQMKPSARAKKPRITPSLAAIRAARKLLARQFAPTRLVAAPFLSKESGNLVYLKLETELPTGTFKVRGALWALAS